MFSRSKATFAPVLQIDRDLDEPHRRLTRLVLSALREFGSAGATRAQLQDKLQVQPQAQVLVTTVLAEAQHDELVDVRPDKLASGPDSRWALNNRGTAALSSAEERDSKNTPVPSAPQAETSVG